MKNYWFFDNTNFTNINGKIFLKKEFKIKTTITSSQIREGFLTLKPFLMDLYSFIRMFEKAGFSTNKHLTSL